MRKMKESGVEWIGEIPEDWKLKKLKFITILCVEKISGENDLMYIGLEHIESQAGKIKNDYESIFDFYGDTIFFNKDNVLYGKLRPYLAKVYFTVTEGKCSSEFFVLQPNGIYGKYLYYLMLSKEFVDIVDSSTFDVKMPRAEWEFVGNIKIPIPPENIQQQIADYLDKKCTEIDSVIKAKKNTNEKLKEYRQSVIYEAVTKGLDKNALMKDSSIKWIGEIPEGWETWKIKHLALNDLQYGANEAGIDFNENLPRYIRITDISQSNKLKDEDKLSLSIEKAEKYILNDGDILFARSGATAGKSFYYTEQYGYSCYAGYLVRLSVNSSLIDSRLIYYYTLTSSYEEWIKQIFIQATIQNVSADKYNNLIIPFSKNKEEQLNIINYLDKKCAEIDSVISANKITIDKLKEYRQSVIYEAVTGKTEI